MMFDSYTIGDYRITRIPETVAPAAVAGEFYPGLDPAQLARDAEWAAPTFYDPDSDKIVLSTHSWLIRTPRFDVLYELGAGNGKQRPKFPRAHRLRTNWPEHLAAAGMAPGDIDFLVASHLHLDHVGWFTTLADNRWMPTFPNAVALIAREEMDNWTPGRRELAFPAWQEGVLEDSVFPLRDAGKLRLVDYGHEIDEGLTIESMRGHTLGHAGLRLRSGGGGAIFCGDAMYSPLQLVHSGLNAYADEDPAANSLTRRRVLAECADDGLVLFPSHFPSPCSAVRVYRHGDGFRFEAADAAGRGRRS